MFTSPQHLHPQCVCTVYTNGTYDNTKAYADERFTYTVAVDTAAGPIDIDDTCFILFDNYNTSWVEQCSIRGRLPARRTERAPSHRPEEETRCGPGRRTSSCDLSSNTNVPRDHVRAAMGMAFGGLHTTVCCCAGSMVECVGRYHWTGNHSGHGRCGQDE